MTVVLFVVGIPVAYILYLLLGPSIGVLFRHRKELLEKLMRR